MADDDTVPMRSNYNQRAQLARQRALRELARRHPEEFTALHDAERKAEGLVPVGLNKFSGTATRRDEQEPKITEREAELVKRFWEGDDEALCDLFEDATGLRPTQGPAQGWND